PHSRLRVHVSHSEASSEVATLSLHDALPISGPDDGAGRCAGGPSRQELYLRRGQYQRLDTAYSQQSALQPCTGTWGWKPELYHHDRKSTRLNCSHVQISYAVFCLKKKAAQRD